MNSAEQTVTWLITLGVLESPKKRISDPESFLQSSLRDGVVLCRLLERLRPGTLLMGKVFPEPRADGECHSNVSEFLRGVGVFSVEVLTCLVALSRATEEKCPAEDGVCVRRPISSSRIKSFESLNTQGQGSSKLLLPQYRSLDMSEGSGCGHTLVKARFPFQQTNEDELSFSKGDLITVLRQEEGGWWEGAVDGRTGWFPSNYVREVKGSDLLQCGPSKHPGDGELSCADIALIQGNLEEISTFQQMLVQLLEERTKLPECQQRVGGFFLGLMSQMKALYTAYCSNHPSAVSVLTQHRPFTRLDRYPALLKELDRHMEDHHPDGADLITCMASQCLEVRKRKELELQILTEPIRNWEGDDIRTLGPVLHMALIGIFNQDCLERSERYLLLFSHTLLILSPSPRMSGFIYQGRIPLSGMLISRIEDGDNLRNAFEISGSQCDRIQVACGTQEELQDWLDLLTKHTHAPSAHAHTQAPPPASYVVKHSTAQQNTCAHIW
ncbi:hypothetical protein NHX12_015029 [Muraenolepis orangiensis]|uniref:Osteoclast-stimulating factor 1 n=1 Tax=Muraenolepis orangiensis TaxID=630683 RepID=A0A9Q0D9R9_9TELE|nr:hypothetical protein NHX12_015029 [Muraenolepis orangiensis]